MATVEHKSYTISLYVPTFVLSKNLELIDTLISTRYSVSDQDLAEANPVEAVYAMWDALMFNSVKGLFEIKFHSQGVTYIAEAQLALGKLASKIKEREALGVTTSKIHLG